MPNILNILKKTVFSKEPFGLLILLAIAMPIAFSTWVALLNNFVIEVSGFSGVDGIFRFTAAGTNQRGLAIAQISDSQVNIIDDAPQSFNRSGM